MGLLTLDLELICSTFFTTLSFTVLHKTTRIDKIIVTCLDVVSCLFSELVLVHYDTFHTIFSHHCEYSHVWSSAGFAKKTK